VSTERQKGRAAAADIKINRVAAENGYGMIAGQIGKRTRTRAD